MKNALRFFAFVWLVILAALAATAAGVLAFAQLALPRPMGYGVAGYLPLDCPAFENVVPTGKATVRLQPLIGRTVDRIILQLGGTALTKAMLSNIRLLANEKVIYEDSGSRIDTRNQYRGLAANAAFLTIDLSEIRAHSDINKHAGALDTVSAGIRSLTMEVDIAGATAPTLSARAQVRPAPQSNNPLYNKLIGKVMSKSFTFGGAGEFPLPLFFQIRPDSFLKRVHLFSAAVTALRVRKTFTNSVTDEIFKATDTQNDFEQGEFQRTPQANQFTADFIPDGNVLEAIPLRDTRDLEFLVTVSGATTITAVSELLDGLQNN
jgi:hypothetical protein